MGDGIGSVRVCSLWTLRRTHTHSIPRPSLPRRGTGLAIDPYRTMHVIAFVIGASIVVAMLWDAFETLVLPARPGGGSWD